MTWHQLVATRLIRNSISRHRLLNQTIAEPLVDAETGEILVEAGTVMTRDVIDSISEHLDDGFEQDCHTPNDSAVLTEPVVLQNSRLWHQQIQTALSLSSAMLIQMIRFVPSLQLISWLR